MGMSIDEALEYLTDFSIYSPYQEAIDKVSAYIEQMQSDYENRLKADMVAMLTDLSMKIGEIDDGYTEFDEENKRSLTMIPLESVERLIDREINSLKAESEPQAEKEQTDD